MLPAPALPGRRRAGGPLAPHPARGAQHARCALQGKITVATLDLADLSSIKALAASPALAALPRLDLLILNAGVMACPLGRPKDGFEMQASERLGGRSEGGAVPGRAGCASVPGGLPAGRV